MTRRIDKPDTEADIELRRYLDAEDRGCFVMVAGAGSGKTTSLVKASIISARGAGAEMRRRGQQVACITYTDRAVGEILTDIANNQLIHVSTIHSFLWTLVKPFQRDIGKWLRLRIEGKLEELVQEGQSYGPRVQEKTRKKNAQDCARMESHLESFERITRFNYENASDYGRGTLGHEDIIKMVPDLIVNKPLLASLVAQKYPFFFVDESQDTVKEVVGALKVVAASAPAGSVWGSLVTPCKKST